MSYKATDESQDETCQKFCRVFFKFLIKHLPSILLVKHPPWISSYSPWINCVTIHHLTSLLLGFGTPADPVLISPIALKGPRLVIQSKIGICYDKDINTIGIYLLLLSTYLLLLCILNHKILNRYSFFFFFWSPVQKQSYRSTKSELTVSSTTLGSSYTKNNFDFLAQPKHLVHALHDFLLFPVCTSIFLIHHKSAFGLISLGGPRLTHSVPFSSKKIFRSFKYGLLHGIIIHVV